MSTISEQFYGCQCDNCGSIAEDGEGHSFWADKDTAQQYAMEGDWKEIDGKDICELCYTIDDNDNITIIESRKKTDTP